MATYSELYGIAVGGAPEDDALREKIATAVAVAAQAYLSDGAATDNQKRWAVRAIGNIKAEAARVMALVVAANAGATVGNIQSASDTAIQTNVDAVASNLADGDALNG